MNQNFADVLHVNNVTATVQSSSIMTAPEENSIIVEILCMLAVEAKGSSSH